MEHDKGKLDNLNNVYFDNDIARIDQWNTAAIFNRMYQYVKMFKNVNNHDVVCLHKLAKHYRDYGDVRVPWNHYDRKPLTAEVVRTWIHYNHLEVRFHRLRKKNVANLKTIKELNWTIGTYRKRILAGTWPE